MQKQNNNQQDLEKKQTTDGQRGQQSNTGFEKPARRDEDMDKEENQSIEQAPNKDKNSKV